MDGSANLAAEQGDRKEKVKDVLNEARMMVLGAQVLVGFQYNAVFHPGFARLPEAGKWALLGSLAMMLVVLALVMAPAPFHRLADLGRDTLRVQRVATRLIEVALVPFSLAVGIDLAVVSQKLLGMAGATGLGGAATGAALTLWYGAGLACRHETKERQTVRFEPTSLKDRVEHMLTETRVVLPGAQALLGFQFTAMLTDKFERVADALKLLHLGSLCFIALAVLLLMAPAPFHRIAANGEDTASVDRFGVTVLLAGMVSLALGIVGDFFLVLHLVGHSALLAGGASAVLLAMFFGLWFVFPILARGR